MSNEHIVLHKAWGERRQFQTALSVKADISGEKVPISYLSAYDIEVYDWAMMIMMAI